MDEQNKTEFYSQCGQDEFLEKNIFKGHKKGYFVDVGAHDGINLNNTLFFERCHGWTGLNIEPLKSRFDDLVINRPNCLNLNVAISNENGKSEFIANEGPTEMLSGLKLSYDERHYKRRDEEIRDYGGSTSTIIVPTCRLARLFRKHGIKEVDYLSIDVEGGEWNVIKSIDFNKVFIHVIGFENNYPDTSTQITNYLKSKGYRFIDKVGCDILMIHQKSKFIKGIGPG